MLAALALLVVGWQLFWFLTDDAFIAFRYVSNSQLGHGYVWNPPPFRPVEGYTSFLWVLLLDGVWRLLGVEPPQAANIISLLFSALTLLLVASMVLRLPWKPRLRPWRVVFLALALVGILTNRTFLAWTSSGLETAMFNFWILLWVWAACSVAPSARQLVLVSVAAAGTYLTRPDGLLLVMATLAMGAVSLPGWRGRALLVRLAAGTPLLLVAVHLLWRHSFYGEWLPNTFFAKSNGLWWESGWRYALSFCLEYGLAIWLVVVVVALLWRGGAGIFSLFGKGSVPVVTGWEARVAAAAPALVCSLAVMTVVAHVVYYTVIIGGDHFEYRVYSQLVPLIWISLLWGLNVLLPFRVAAVAVLVFALALSWPLGWRHWVKTHQLNRADSTHMGVGINTDFPPWARPYAWLFDDCQGWLIEHFVCIRHQEHKTFLLEQVADHPTRAQGARISDDGFPVMATKTVGYTGWVLPHVNILDLHGLNDYVIARGPLDPQRFRRMAHEHLPPAGYTTGFAVNVTFSNVEVRVQPRATPLTAEDIRRLEAQWARWLLAPTAPLPAIAQE